ncbi:acyltransferase [Pseudarthrobacter sp. NPDC092419]|uniref:acyltransferase family protein n=1 Tax=Pseudarthrobacter sp. NPDC092419 TaxID=3364414 RepID=UPI0037FD8530
MSGIDPVELRVQPGAEPVRDPAIDLVRCISLALVVVGHAMMVSPVLHPDGTVTTQNTLGDQDWFEPVIWVFMVMPLFFVTGGITGLQSWRRLVARGGTAADFVRGRLRRFLRPAVAVLAAMFLGFWLAGLLGVHPQVVQLLASGGAMPLWFLAAYLAAQLNIPLLSALHSRSPWLTFLGLAALVVAVDSCRGAVPELAYLNLLFLWWAVQQLGFLMADGHAARLSRPALAGIALAANLVMGVVTALGIYSNNMLVNLNPPNLTLLLLGISQASLMQLARPALTAAGSAPRVRRLLLVTGSRSLTVYLWHLPLLGAMSGLLLLTPFPKPAAGTAEWWWARPIVLLALAILLVPVLAAFGHLEQRTTASPATGFRPAAAAGAAVVVFFPAAAGALTGLTLELLGVGAVCFALALLLLRDRHAPRRRSGTLAARDAHRKRRRGKGGIASGVK